MDENTGLPLALGGHSFIEQLGNDPPATEEEQALIVAECLDSGILWFDTTYQPERVALGRALKKLGRRDEASIIAWNFFKDFGAGGNLGGPSRYMPHHIDLMLEQLCTDRIECLVVHRVENEDENAGQEELAVSWKKKGYVKELGAWAPGADVKEKYNGGGAYDFMVCPFSVTGSPATKDVFKKCGALGWRKFACSPFGRGWELDKLARKAAAARKMTEPAAKELLSDMMLRYSLFESCADLLIVAMRRKEWVRKNAESIGKGKLNARELELLAGCARGS